MRALHNQAASDQLIIQRTECWVASVVIANHFCPFAKRELDGKRIRYTVSENKKNVACLNALIDECIVLDTNDSIETTLLIFKNAFESFKDYLQLVKKCEKHLEKNNYQGVYQVASFHPEYIFADSDEQDAANYTNRSPYPMLHIIREASIEKALHNHPDPDSIPVKNIARARLLGLETMRNSLDECYIAGENHHEPG